MTTEQKHNSLWQSVHLPYFSKLTQDTSCDVCIVGAGISGLTTAYQLISRGISVIVLDDGGIGGGETSRTSAHISNVLDSRYSKLERVHGRNGARLAAESHAAAIKTIETISQQEGIACEWRHLDGYLFLGEGDDETELDREYQAATAAGLEVNRLNKIPKMPFASGPCLQFPKQAQLHPLKYLKGLALAVAAKGVQLHTFTHVDAIEGGDHPMVRTSSRHTVTAKHVVVATNSPVHLRLAIHTKQAAYRSYVIGLEIPANYAPAGLFWDTEDPFHYIRVAKDQNHQDILLVGGGDHKTGQDGLNKDHFERLASWTRQRFPLAGRCMHEWSGQIMNSMDGLAYIGKDPTTKNIYLATGDSGNGLTHGTIAGSILSDAILGRPNPWQALYDPGRMSLLSAGAYAKENTNTGFQYSSWLTPGDVASTDDINSDSGAVIRRGLHKVAVYRDRSGKCHELQATCPHLAGIVTWNDNEKTWDCPCHGSRFDRFGKVINGPAISNLSPTIPEELADIADDTSDIGRSEGGTLNI